MDKKYLDYDGLAIVADEIKTRSDEAIAVAGAASAQASEAQQGLLDKLDKVTTMPSEPHDGDTCIFIGTTSGSYTKGHVYQYQTNAWVDISPSGGSITVDQTYNPSSTNAQSGTAVAEAVASIPGGSTNYNDLTNKPTINGKVLVSNGDGKTYRLVDMDDLPYVNDLEETAFPTLNYGIYSLYEFNNTLYVGTGAGIYTSINGTTFTQNTSFPTNYSVRAFIEFNNTLYVGTYQHGMYTSTDGSTFTQHSHPSSNISVSSFSIFNNKLYAIMGEVVSFSSDGETFTDLNNMPFLCDDKLYVFNNKLYVETIDISAQEGGIWISTNGSDFTHTNFPHNYNINAFCEFNNKLYIGTTSHGIYTTTDGSTFTQNNSFPTNYTVYSLYEFDGTLYTGTDSHGIYTSINGNTFTQFDSSVIEIDETVYSSFTKFKNILIVGSWWTGGPGGTMYNIHLEIKYDTTPTKDSDGLMKSGDMYNSITKIEDGFTQITSFDTISLYKFNNAIYASSSADNTKTGVYKSTDGSTFTRFSYNSFPTIYDVNTFIEFNDTLYGGAHGIYISSDGSTFKTGVNGFANNKIALSFYEFSDKLYVGTASDGIYISSNGSSFSKNYSLPTNYSVNTFIKFKDALYIGTDSHGIYTSSDGSTFTQNASFPNSTTVKSLIEFNNILYVGTDSHGIYTSSDGSTFTQINNNSFPTDYTVKSFVNYDDKLYVGCNHGIYIKSLSVSPFVSDLSEKLIPQAIPVSSITPLFD